MPEKVILGLMKIGTSPSHLDPPFHLRKLLHRSAVNEEETLAEESPQFQVRSGLEWTNTAPRRRELNLLGLTLHGCLCPPPGDEAPVDHTQIWMHLASKRGCWSSQAAQLSVSTIFVVS